MFLDATPSLSHVWHHGVAFTLSSATCHRSSTHVPLNCRREPFGAPGEGSCKRSHGGSRCLCASSRVRAHYVPGVQCVNLHERPLQGQLCALGACAGRRTYLGRGTHCRGRTDRLGRRRHSGGRGACVVRRGCSQRPAAGIGGDHHRCQSFCRTTALEVSLAQVSTASGLSPHHGAAIASEGRAGRTIGPDPSGRVVHIHGMKPCETTSNTTAIVPSRVMP